MNDLLFDTPLWLLGLLIVGGGFVWYTGNRLGERSWKITGIVIAIVGLTLSATSWLVQTDKEIVETKSRLIVSSFGNKDWATLESTLDPHTSLEDVYKNRDEIVAGAKKTVDTIGLSSAKVTGVQVKQADTAITVDLNILSYQEITMDRPTLTSWRFDWENTGTGWKLARIEPEENAQVSREDITANLQRIKD